MADSIKIGNLDISSFKVGSGDCSIYLGDTLLYPLTPPTPTGSTCYEIISTPITSYTSTTYDSVYSFSDSKWYMLNNLNQYEEYGVYDVVEDISSATTYDGKLAVVGTTEYQYSGSSWSVVGTYEDASVTYEITDEDQYKYSGVTLSTTFKIPKADSSSFNIYIYDDNDNYLWIRQNTYKLFGSSREDGTVTSDSDYYYYSMTNLQSIIISSIEYWDSTPIHLIVGSKQASVEYSAKTTPSSALTYSSVADMEAVSCPTVGVGQYCYTNGQVYKYTSDEQWESVQDSELMIKSFNANGEVGIMGCGYNNGEVKKDNYVSGATDIWLGNCATSINDIWNGLYNTLSSMTISSTVPPTYSSNSSIPQYLEVKVPCNSVHSYRTSKGWNTLCNKITSDEPNCQTEINYKARLYGSDNALLTEIPRSSASSGNMITSAETLLYASTTYSIEFGDCFNVINSGTCRYFKMTNVTIPDNVTSIGTLAFNNCTSLTSCTIGSGVTIIGSSAFTQCNRLTSINIPSGVTYIDQYAFHYCTSLTSIDIPNSVILINNVAFGNCTSLTSCTIGDSVTRIGDNAFQWCTSLSSIDIPSGVTSIGAYTFYNCSGLTSITVNATTPPTLNSTAFNNTNCPIYVPSASVEAYKAATNWSTYASRIQAIQNS